MELSTVCKKYLPLSFAFLLASCCKTEETEYSLSEFWDCRQQDRQDSAELHQALLGRWEWDFVRCYWTPEKANSHEYRGLQIHIVDPDSLEVLQNRVAIQTSKWKLVPTDGSFYKIEADPPVDPFQGRILRCQNRIVFNASYFDGCDHFFHKKE
jgi:hypothetical protein